MLFEYEVVIFENEINGNEDVETGLVLGRADTERQAFAEAIIELHKYYGTDLVKVTLTPFAPDEPLRVSKELINEIGKDVIW